MPVSWQSLHHDEGLLDNSLEPSIVAIIDAPQLAERPGKLVEAIDAIRDDSPTSLIWTPGIGGPDNCALLSWMGVDLFDLSRSKEAVARGVILTEDGPREPESTAGEISDLQTQIDAWKRASGQHVPPSEKERFVRWQNDRRCPALGLSRDFEDTIQ